MVNKVDHMNTLLEAVPAVKALLGVVLQQIGIPADRVQFCKMIHFLVQDDTSQARLKWHADNNGVGSRLSHRVLTAVVQLSLSYTEMRMWLHPSRFGFDGRGTGGIFYGAAIHESCKNQSLAVQGPVFKVVFFIDEL